MVNSKHSARMFFFRLFLERVRRLLYERHVVPLRTRPLRTINVRNRNLLQDEVSGCVNSKLKNVNWSTVSCDLTTLRLVLEGIYM